jgi:hypothetical protein
MHFAELVNHSCLNMDAVGTCLMRVLLLRNMKHVAQKRFMRLYLARIYTLPVECNTRRA